MTNRILTCARLALALAALPVLGLAQTLTRDVDNPARSPQRYAGNFTINAFATAGDISFQVPSQKRFVAEYLHVQCSPSASTLPAVVEFSISTYDVNANNAVTVDLLPSKSSTGFFNFAQNIRLYADHSGYSWMSSIAVTANTAQQIPANHSYFCKTVLSGYTVSLTPQ